MYQSYFDLTKLLPLVNEVWGKVIFSEVCVSRILSIGRVVVSQHALQVVSQHVLQQVSWFGGVVSQHALQVSRGEVSRPTPRGEVEGSGWGGGSPGPRGRLLPRAVRILLECIPVELIFRLKVLLKI